MNKLKLIISTFSIVTMISCSEQSKESIHSEKDTPADLSTTDNITIKIGKTFTVGLSENASTGSSNCWINQNKCNNVEIYNKIYESPQKEKERCEGCSVILYWKFIAKNIGVDTIKIQNCPTGKEQKNCDQFQEDSSSYQKIIKQKPKVDKTIVVKIIK